MNRKMTQFGCSNAKETMAKKIVASILKYYSPITENSMKRKGNHKKQD